jgi:hypothetical protein
MGFFWLVSTGTALPFSRPDAQSGTDISDKKDDFIAMKAEATRRILIFSRGLRQMLIDK